MLALRHAAMGYLCHKCDASECDTPGRATHLDAARSIRCMEDPAMPNPVQVFNLADIDGEARSAIMGVVKSLGGYSESMPSPSPEVRGEVTIQMTFTIKRGSPAGVGATPWQAIALAALDCLNGQTQDRVLRDAVSAPRDFHPALKSRTEHAVTQWREALRIANGTRPGNITGTVTGSARFS